jgi:methyltransferase-like protein/ubiquinone/menaquinone biosynthesis C-methylase UbiE
MTNSPANAYDVVQYPDLAYANTHPDRLATLATLFGLQPPPVTRCRVLELGCAAGGNLLPMAYTLPESEFVGLDYSLRQIEEGRKRMRILGVRNVRLLHRDLMEISDQEAAELGQFDYIIAHGLYSWVAAPVRDRAVALCKRLLSPNGIAFISFNAYPGWHVYGIVRDVMRYHTRGIEDPMQKAAAAREIVQLMADCLQREENPAYAAPFESYLNRWKSSLPEANDAFLLHDELEEVNDPVYFSDFVEHMERHGLQYLVDAQLYTVFAHMMGPDVASSLQKVAKDPIELEQYMDFLRGRMFRQSLLCHADLKINRILSPASIRNLLVGSGVVPSTGEAADGKASEGSGKAAPRTYRASDGTHITTDHPFTQAAMEILLRHWPAALPFGELVQRVRAGGYVPDATDLDVGMLAANLLRAFVTSPALVSLHVYAPPVVNYLSERPVASAAARMEALTRLTLTSLRHERVVINDLRRWILLRLDGTRTRHDLLAGLIEALEKGVVKFNAEISGVDVDVRSLLEKELDSALAFFGNTALLEA